MNDAELAISAATAGAAVVRRHYGGPLTRHAKSATDFATQADLEAEQSIRATIAKARPDDAFLGEEGGLDGDASAARTWLVDPLCGTLNFAAQTPLVGVNVALRDGTRVVAAAVADPFSREVFWTDGHQANRHTTAGDEPIAPSAITRLVDLDMDNDPVWAARMASSSEFTPRFGIRVMSTSLAATWVALGRRAGYVQRGCGRDSVHFAAPIAICRAAGCLVTDLAGHELGDGPDGLVVAADRETHDALLEAIRGLA